MFSRTGLSYLLNKIHLTFEIVPCLILGLFRQFLEGVRTSILAQRYEGWVSGRRDGVGGVGVGRKGKTTQVKTRGQKLPTDGPDQATRPKGRHHSGQE